MKFRFYGIVFSLLLTHLVHAQDADSLLSNVDTEYSAEDSVSIFNLIDSLLALQEVKSQFSFRLGYNSNVLSAGRTLGIKNFGLAPGVSYHHKSGMYADITGYWSKDFEPAYYLTVFSLGYMHDFSKRFSMMAEYDKYFYNLADNYLPYTNAFSVTPIIELSPVSLSVNYSFYFGDQIAHRIMPGVSVLFERKKIFGLDRVAIAPAVYMLTGNEVLTTLEIVPPQTLREALQNLKLYGTRYSMIETSKNVYGVMNYALTLPISATFKQWNLLFSYTYNIPKALEGEPLTISESSFLSGSMSYYISARAK